MCACLVAWLCPTLSDSVDCSLPGSSVHGDSPGKNTGVCWHSLPRGIFPTWGSNPGLLHCRQILYHWAIRKISVFLGILNGNPLQYSCLENPRDRWNWWATFHGVTRVGHSLVTKPPPGILQHLFSLWIQFCIDFLVDTMYQVPLFILVIDLSFIILNSFLIKLIRTLRKVERDVCAQSTVLNPMHGHSNFEWILDRTFRAKNDRRKSISR